jgi:hypothetical protein
MSLKNKTTKTQRGGKTSGLPVKKRKRAGWQVGGITARGQNFGVSHFKWM